MNSNTVMRMLYHANECQCNMKEIEAFRDDLTDFSVVTTLKSTGKKVRLADSFGFRFQYPGKDPKCFQKYVDAYNASSMDDD